MFTSLDFFVFENFNTERNAQPVYKLNVSSLFLKYDKHAFYDFVLTCT